MVVDWRTGHAQPLESSNPESRSSLRTMISALENKPSRRREKAPDRDRLSLDDEKIRP